MTARPHDGLSLDAAVCTRRSCRQLCDLVGAMFGRHDGFVPRPGKPPVLTTASRSRADRLHCGHRC
eukprot:1234080-Prymnesium_polylepis.1